MAAKVKTVFGVQRRKLLFIIFLFVGVLLLGSLVSCIFMMSTKESSLEGAVHVSSESELRNAIDNAKSDTQVVIALDNDIALTGSNYLDILPNKDITLKSNRMNGFYKILGPKNTGYEGRVFSVDTIVVRDGGVLRLDGVVVAHVKDAMGTGIRVYEGGTLIMYEGKISGNYNPDRYLGHGGYDGGSGGVFNGGVFEMFGGEISGNTGKVGGGVTNRGNFTMYGGKISGNRVPMSGGPMTGGIRSGWGGGVDSSGNFTMHNGKIINNYADISGGGIDNSGNFEMFNGEISNNIAGYSGGGVNTGNFTMHGGKISGNKADQKGGGVCGTVNRLGGTISGNKAPEGNNIYPQADNEIEYKGRYLQLIGVSAVVIIMGVILGLFLYSNRKKKSWSHHL